MRGAIFIETLRRGWRGMLYWSIGLGLLTMIQVIVIPDVQALEEMAQLMGTLPSWMLSAFGINDMEYLATAEGYVALQFFSYALVMFSIYAVTQGLGVTSGDEDRGTLDLVLAVSLPRTRLIIEKLAAYSVLCIGFILLTYLWLWFGVLITPALVVDMNKMFAVTLTMIPPTLMVLAFTTLIGAFFRNRGFAVAIASAFVAVSYTLQLVGSAVQGGIGSTLSTLSYFKYADSISNLTQGINYTNIIGILIAAVVMFLISLWHFNRRDIGGL